jgi:hypothetical protein
VSGTAACQARSPLEPVSERHQQLPSS